MSAVILFLATFSRLFKVFDLQYYSFDDEIYATIIRQILVNHKLVLVVPAPTLGISSGSLWYWLAAPVYFLARFNPVATLALGSLFGLVTTYFIYYVGTKAASRTIGLITSLLYAGSFSASLADRHWSPLSFHPFLLVLALYSIFRMIQGKLAFALPLAVSLSFIWHSDATLAIVGLAAIIAALSFRLPLFRRAYLPALAYLILSLSPFVIFEFRHPGAITGPLGQLLTKTASSQTRNQISPSWLNPDSVALGLSYGLFAPPTATAEDYVYPHSGSRLLNLPLVVKLVVLGLILFPLYLLLNHRSPHHRFLVLLYIFLFSFLAGIIFINLALNVRIVRHYYIVIWPIVFFLTTFTLDWLFRHRQALMALGFLMIFLLANFYTLLNSRMRYRLYQKVQLMNLIVPHLTSPDFSLYGLKDPHLFAGGFGSILMTHNLFPRNRNYYVLDWIFQAYSLYSVPVVDEDKFDQKIVIYPSDFTPDWSLYPGFLPDQTYRVDNITAAILRPVSRIKH